MFRPLVVCVIPAGNLDCKSASLERVDLEHLVPVVVDDLDGNLSRRGRVEGVALGAVEGGPLGFVDLGAEGSFEFAIGVVVPRK